MTRLLVFIFVAFAIAMPLKAQKIERGTPEWEALKKRVRMTHRQHVLPLVQAKHNNPYLLKMVVSLGDLGLDAIGLTQEQQADSKAIVDQLEKDLGALETQYANLDAKQRNDRINLETRKLKNKATQKLANLLMDHQLLDMLQWKPESTGLPKVLVDTPIGEVIGITEQQRESIRTAGVKLAARIEREVELCGKKHTKKFLAT